MDKQEKKQNRVITKTSQKGCEIGYTRATFITTEDILDKLKDYTYDQRLTVKEAVNEMLESYLKNKKIKHKRPEHKKGVGGVHRI